MRKYSRFYISDPLKVSMKESMRRKDKEKYQGPGQFFCLRELKGSPCPNPRAEPPLILLATRVLVDLRHTKEIPLSVSHLGPICISQEGFLLFHLYPHLPLPMTNSCSCFKIPVTCHFLCENIPD